MVKIVCWFSCGCNSAVAAYATTIFYPEDEITIARCVVDNEHPDNDRFHKDCEKWLGREIISLRSEEFADCWEVWEKRRYLSGIKGAPCTVEMKKVPRWEYQAKFDPDYQVFGFSSDETTRANRFAQNNPEVRLLLPLIERGITKPKCQEIIKGIGIKLPRMYELGFKNNNCMGCVKATSPAYWARVRKNFPAYFESMCEISRRLRCRLVRLNGERIYLDQLPQDNDYIVPASDEEDFECGIACSIDEKQTTPDISLEQLLE